MICSARAVRFAAILLMGWLALLSVGCGGSKSSNKTVVNTPLEQPEPEADLVSRLQKPTDLLSAAKEVLQGVEALGPKLKIEAMPAADQAAIQKLLHLAPLELEEVARGSFSASGLDVAYLSESLLIHDAITSLGLAKQPPLKQAELAIHWVGRQVILQDRSTLVAPVWYTLQRGAGNILERAYVMLAAMQQLGIDAALIGPRDLGQAATFVSEGENQIRMAPFWGIAVRIDDQIYVFNPLTAKPFPTLDGKGIATLSQLTTDSKLVENWLNAKPPIVKLNPNQTKDFKLYLGTSISSLAPRMRTLEEKLKPNGVKLSVDLKTMTERLKKASESTKVEVEIWSPENDPLCVGRVLPYFLPPDRGGLGGGARTQLFETYLMDTLHLEQLELPVQDLSLARSALVGLFREKVSRLYLFGPNLPRERLVRGKLDDAIPMLTDDKDKIEAAKLRVEREVNLDRDIAKWIQDFDAVLARAKRAERTKNQQELDQANREQVEYLRDPIKGRVFDSFLIRATSRVMSAESTYLISLAVHEQAERYQLRYETEKHPELEPLTRDSWHNAREWWNRYLQNYPELAEQEKVRNEQARQLQARAIEKLNAIPTASKGKEKK